MLRLEMGYRGDSFGRMLTSNASSEHKFRDGVAARMSEVPRVVCSGR